MAKCMKSYKIPHVCFKVTSAAVEGFGDELLRVLEKHLSTQFNLVKVINGRLFPVWNIVIKENNQSFTTCFFRNRHTNGEWILLVRPLDAATLWSRLCRREQSPCTSELKLVSQNIHAVLITISGVGAIRWYFEDRLMQSRAVDTPDKLPWAELQSG